MKTSFVFYAEWRNALDVLPPRLRAEACLAVVDYVLTGECAPVSEEAEHAFRVVKEMVDKKSSVSEKRREAGRKGMSSRYGNNFVITNSNKTQFCYNKPVTKPDFVITKPDFVITNSNKTRFCYNKTENGKEEKNGKEETSFLPPTPPIYPKEEKEKKGETPSRPPLTPVESEKFRLESASPADETGTKPKRKPLDPASLPPGFVAFWNAYPPRRRVDKRGCFQKWKDNGLEAQAKIIVADVRKRAESDDWTRENAKFVPMSTTYLNQTRWDCEEIAQNSTFTGGRDPSAVEPLSPDEICRRRREAYFAEVRRRNRLIYGKDACRNADDADDDFNEPL